VISCADLKKLGNAADYLRVASNMSTAVEAVLAREHGISVAQVFTFASRHMPIVTAVLAAKAPHVHIHASDADLVPSDMLLSLVALLGCSTAILVKIGVSPPVSGTQRSDSVVISVEASLDPTSSTTHFADAVVVPNVLLVVNPAKVDPTAALRIRKRMATPLTTAPAQAMLERKAGLRPSADSATAGAGEVGALLAHLRTLAGAEPGSAQPIVCTAGLSALASLWITLAQRGGTDVVMASTAYGGSSEVTDIVAACAPTRLRKHTFDLQGNAQIDQSIRGALHGLASAEHLLPMVALFVEVPSNPDQKVVDLEALAASVTEFQLRTYQKVIVILDTTFAPGSGVLRKLRQLAPKIPAIAFTSLSKSISRGMTTAGSLVANHTDVAQALLTDVLKVARALDVVARRDQMMQLVRNHKGVEARCEQAYKVAADLGATLCMHPALQNRMKLSSVAPAGATLCMYPALQNRMKLSFVTPEQAALGFTSPSFSFNLPAPPGMSQSEKAGLAQSFVDALCVNHRIFKPCVSFGQDNGLIYCTVPATSTQGAISDVDKSKQSVDGVQLVRLSFPPKLDLEGARQCIIQAVSSIMSKAGQA